jgi:hypothetical protein
MRFKTTENIFKGIELYGTKDLDFKYDELPPKLNWDYSRDLKIEDIDLWEVIYEGGQNRCVYAAYMPYAEFYMVRVGLEEEILNNHGVETYYGPGSEKQVRKRMKDLGMWAPLNEIWIEPEDMWLYQN